MATDCILRYRMGAAVIGLTVSAVLLGVTYTQLFYYYTSEF